MKKLLVKTIVMFLAIAVLISLFYSYSTNASSAISTIYNNGSIENTGGANTMAQNILTIVLDVIRIGGAAIAVAILMVIAAKYIMASAGDRADIKKYAMNYVIGAVVFFGASGILTLIRNTIKETV